MEEIDLPRRKPEISIFMLVLSSNSLVHQQPVTNRKKHQQSTSYKKLGYKVKNNKIYLGNLD